MSGLAFTFRMPSGIPGSISRNSDLPIEPNTISTTTPPTVYGNPVALDASQNMRPIAAGDTSASVYGFLVRPFPTNSGTQGLGVSTPPTSGTCSVLKMGYMNVAVTNGTPVKGGAVYIRTVVNVALPNTYIGDVEAAADSTNSFILTGAYFTGGIDANGNSEIAFGI
ncbi:MAG: hypothetical protein VST70_01635 [Nitrospirota bacterium]|nr:hypothetical protein [Nitrospirota bacterium]